MYVTAPCQNQPIFNLDLQATNQCLQLRKPRDTSTAVVPNPCTNLDYTASQMTLINPSSSTKGLNDHTTPNITSQVFLSLFHFIWVRQGLEALSKTSTTYPVLTILRALRNDASILYIFAWWAVVFERATVEYGFGSFAEKGLFLPFLTECYTLSVLCYPEKWGNL